MAERVQELIEELAYAEDALREIVQGRGAYSRDPLQHCNNTVENMTAVAQDALNRLAIQEVPRG